MITQAVVKEFAGGIFARFGVYIATAVVAGVLAWATVFHLNAVANARIEAAQEEREANRKAADKAMALVQRQHEARAKMLQTLLDTQREEAALRDQEASEANARLEGELAKLVGTPKQAWSSAVAREIFK